MTKRATITWVGAAAAAALVAVPAAARTTAADVDWSKVPERSVRLFYPGQSSYEWTLSKAHRRADRQVAAGESCVSCHQDEEADIGKLIAAGERLEPTPMPDKSGHVDLGVQIAYDADNAYFRFHWKTQNPFPGEAHPFKRFDGEKWVHFGYPKLDAVVRSGEQPGIYEDRLSMLIDDGKVANFATHGCWVACHNGQRDMPDVAGKGVVQANALLGKGGLNKSDVRKYLPATRSGPGWGDTLGADAVAAQKAGGAFLDLMQWRAHRSNPVGMADDFYVLEYRLEDDGEGPFSSNWDKVKNQPKYMYDEAVTGSAATRLENIRTKPTALVREGNARPFDAARAWREGDLIPAYVTSREVASGSAADNAHAEGKWANGSWTVVWTRPLGLTHADDKALVVGGRYTFGFAVHDDNVTTRGHFVSWPMTVGFGAEADIAATRLE